MRWPSAGSKKRSKKGINVTALGRGWGKDRKNIKEYERRVQVRFCQKKPNEILQSK